MTKTNHKQDQNKQNKKPKQNKKQNKNEREKERENAQSRKPQQQFKKKYSFTSKRRQLISLVEYTSNERESTDRPKHNTSSYLLMSMQFMMCYLRS